MKILISGSTGLLGNALVSRLRGKGHGVARLVRSKPNAGGETPEIFWKPDEGKIDAAGIEGFDAVVHLAGENIAASRWDEPAKRRIRESRVKGTRLLAETLARLDAPPRVFISASAAGFYGSRDDEVLTESSPPGKGFLPDVCRAWESAADPARAGGIRVVHPRFGMVLSPKGGALAKMLPPFQLGIAGKIGRGDQYLAWIALDDAIRIVEYVIETESLEGPVNAVAPEPVTNAEFTRALGHVLSRPTIAMMPSFVARLLFGEMADELLLASCRAVPRRLLDAGFVFGSPDIEAAFRRVLGV